MVDCCVWPNNAQYLNVCTQVFQSLLALSPDHAGHVQLPVPQSQALDKAVLKQRRILEDMLGQAGLDALRSVSLFFDKAGCPAGDKRDPWHPCLFVTATGHEVNSWSQCAVGTQRSIGPCPLIRVVDMLGFDSENRPGAAAGAEQSFCILCYCRFFYWELFEIISLGAESI